MAVRLLSRVLAIVALVLVVRTFVVQPFTIPSESMAPTLLTGDYVYVSKFAYGYSRYSFPFGLPAIAGRWLFRAPERGDVAVFKGPVDNATDFIKRVVGLPGDRIQVRAGVLRINGEPVRRERIEDHVEGDGRAARRYAAYVETLPNGRAHRIIEASDTGPLDDTPEYRVPAAHYFVMGDNRDNSADSRVPPVIGVVPAVNLVGRAELVFFSTDGTARLWQVWRWPAAIRFDRMVRTVR